MPILRYSAASPYARKARIVAELCGLGPSLTLEGADTSNPEDSLRAQNPLGKVPTLILETGETIYDSRVICDYFDLLVGGGKVVPLDPAARIAALTLQSLGDGINDAALLIRYEVTRPENLRDPKWIALQQGKIDRALAELNARSPAFPVTVGHVALACALGYLDYRFGGEWRAAHPALVAWLDEFSRAVPAFEATRVA
ncbi:MULTISPECIES: glutathione S-transferase family protein [Methylosinus]|uniref:Glutathione S-transferase family protein n=1 Tax=Methylosinus trichosporium (strain ATCC 35070 / NCIMB 11131 / UNIQEM 75 / OB3b) TaxID=595536 RepID=A0A2D2CVP2_METT3|nr:MULTISPECIES: glutathione S-transferase family protein [Methylosinus]ATQ66807.1 glutathione S-transferase family protein [Methylosinus trichosporium OB3b]OBS50624.1 glutathione S-transferase [Methylosinus sp. 3S-1]